MSYIWWLHGIREVLLWKELLEACTYWWVQAFILCTLLVLDYAQEKCVTFRNSVGHPLANSTIQWVISENVNDGPNDRQMVLEPRYYYCNPYIILSFHKTLHGKLTFMSNIQRNIINILYLIEKICWLSLQRLYNFI